MGNTALQPHRDNAAPTTAAGPNAEAGESPSAADSRSTSARGGIPPSPSAATLDQQVGRDEGRTTAAPSVPAYLQRCNDSRRGTIGESGAGDPRQPRHGGVEANAGPEETAAELYRQCCTERRGHFSAPRRPTLETDLRGHFAACGPSSDEAAKQAALELLDAIVQNDSDRVHEVLNRAAVANWLFVSRPDGLSAQVLGNQLNQPEPQQQPEAEEPRGPPSSPLLPLPPSVQPHAPPPPLSPRPPSLTQQPEGQLTAGGPLPTSSIAVIQASAEPAGGTHSGSIPQVHEIEPASDSATLAAVPVEALEAHEVYAQLRSHAYLFDACTPLSVAAALGHREVVTKLLAAGAKPDPPDTDTLPCWISPLAAAAVWGDSGVVKELLDKLDKQAVPDKECRLGRLTFSPLAVSPSWDVWTAVTRNPSHNDRMFSDDEVNLLIAMMQRLESDDRQFLTSSEKANSLQRQFLQGGNGSMDDVALMWRYNWLYHAADPRIVQVWVQRGGLGIAAARFFGLPDDVAKALPSQAIPASATREDASNDVHKCTSSSLADAAMYMIMNIDSCELVRQGLGVVPDCGTLPTDTLEQCTALWQIVGGSIKEVFNKDGLNVWNTLYKASSAQLAALRVAGALGDMSLMCSGWQALMQRILQFTPPDVFITTSSEWSSWMRGSLFSVLIHLYGDQMQDLFGPLPLGLGCVSSKALTMPHAESLGRMQNFFWDTSKVGGDDKPTMSEELRRKYTELLLLVQPDARDVWTSGSLSHYLDLCQRELESALSNLHNASKFLGELRKGHVLDKQHLTSLVLQLADHLRASLQQDNLDRRTPVSSLAYFGLVCLSECTNNFNSDKGGIPEPRRMEWGLMVLHPLLKRLTADYTDTSEKLLALTEYILSNHGDDLLDSLLQHLYNTKSSPTDADGTLVTETDACNLCQLLIRTALTEGYIFSKCLRLLTHCLARASEVPSKLSPQLEQLYNCLMKNSSTRLCLVDLLTFRGHKVLDGGLGWPSSPDGLGETLDADLQSQSLPPALQRGARGAAYQGFITSAVNNASSLLKDGHHHHVPMWGLCLKPADVYHGRDMTATTATTATAALQWDQRRAVLCWSAFAVMLQGFTLCGLACSILYWVGASITNMVHLQLIIRQQSVKKLKVTARTVLLPGSTSTLIPTLPHLFSEMLRSPGMPVQMWSSPAVAALVMHYWLNFTVDAVFQMLLVRVAYTLTFIVYALSLIEGGREPTCPDDKQTPLMAVLAVMTLEYAVIEIRQLLFNDGGLQRWMSEPWNYFDAGQIGLMVATLSMHWSCRADMDVIRGMSQVLVLVLSWRSLQYLTIFEALARFVRMVMEVTYDLRHFFIFLGVVYCSFGVSLMVVAPGWEPEPSSDNIGRAKIVFLRLYSMLFGDFGVADLLDPGVSSPGLAYTTAIISSLYMLFVTIILLNLLIAIVGSAYNRVVGDDDASKVHYYLRDKAAMIVEVENLFPERFKAARNKALLECEALLVIQAEEVLFKLHRKRAREAKLAEGDAGFDLDGAVGPGAAADDSDADGEDAHEEQLYQAVKLLERRVREQGERAGKEVRKEVKEELKAAKEEVGKEVAEGLKEHCEVIEKKLAEGFRECKEGSAAVQVELLQQSGLERRLENIEKALEGLLLRGGKAADGGSTAGSSAAQQ